MTTFHPSSSPPRQLARRRGHQDPGHGEHGGGGYPGGLPAGRGHLQKDETRKSYSLHGCLYESAKASHCHQPL